MEKNIDVLSTLEFDHQVSDHLFKTAKWNRILAIFWFVLCGLFALLLILSLAGTLDRNGAPGFGMIVFIGTSLLWIVAMFIASVLRYRFAVRTMRAIRESDQQLLVNSLGQFRLYGKYMTIMTMIATALVLLGVGVSVVEDMSAL